MKDFGKEYSITFTRVQKTGFIQFLKCVGGSKPDNSSNEGNVANGESCIGNKDTAGAVRGDDPETGIACGFEGKFSVSQSQNPVHGALLTVCNCNRYDKHRNRKTKRKRNTERNRSHEKRSHLHSIVQDKEYSITFTRVQVRAFLM